MTASTTVEERLLLAANTGDLKTIVDIVSRMTPKEKEAINPIAYDIVLFSISHSASEPLEQAYTTMMFIRHVGHYISPASVSALLNKPEAASSKFRRRATDVADFNDAEIAKLRTQAAV